MAAGDLVFGTAKDYMSPVGDAEQPTSGRVVALTGDGAEGLSRVTSAAVVAGLVSAPGVAVAVTLTGEVAQLGLARRLMAPAGPTGSVKILSWRER